MAEVKLLNVSKKYGRKTAVDGVTLACREGEFLSIFGPTGAGKSTILKMIAGIEEVSGGEIHFNGRLVNELPPQERNISMAFESYNLYPHMTVYENIAFPLRAPRWRLNLTRAEERQKVEEIARFLGIDDLLERLPQHLSGGQKQRVSLSRALVRRPDVYLLDEPIAHLDARLKFSTQSLLKEFAARYRSTIIYVTHDYREALALSDRICILRRGRVEQEGAPEEIYYRPATEFVGRMIGEPPMNLIDGQVVTRDGAPCFQAGASFILPVRGPLADSLARSARAQDGASCACLGIRCEHIALSRSRASERAFQLPVYAVTQEAASAVISFALEGSFLYARTREEIGSATFGAGERIWLDFDEKNVLFFPPSAKTAK